MSPHPEPEHPQPEPVSWKRLGGLILALLLCLGLLWLTQWSGCGSNSAKDHPPVRSTYYYQLITHMRKMGPAVYQATGDQGKSNSKPLNQWLDRSQTLVRLLGKDEDSSEACRQKARETEVELMQMRQQTKGQEAYNTGYQAWQKINDLLLKCK